MYTFYLDNAATTNMYKEVVDGMLPYMQHEFGNPGSIHDKGRVAADAVSVARKRVADFIGAKPEQIIFTSSGSEANNLAIQGMLPYLDGIGKRRVITSAVEHDSILNTVKAFCTIQDVDRDTHKNTTYSQKTLIKSEFYADIVGVNKFGVVNVDELSKIISSDTGLVSIMYMNNEIGAENDIKAISKVCREKGIMFHTDCVQAAGATIIDVNEIGCDMLSFSAHKIHGPKGIGALYVRDPAKLSPIIYGGSMQEFGKRGGTENVPAIVGFGIACKISKENVYERILFGFNNKLLFVNRLFERLKDLGIESVASVNGIPPQHNLGKTVNIRFDNVDAESLVLMLSAKGIYISAGSACRSLESEPSHVLVAIGLTPDEARDSVRFSFDDTENNPDSIHKIADEVAECVKLLLDSSSGGVANADTRC